MKHRCRYCRRKRQEKNLSFSAALGIGVWVCYDPQECVRYIEQRMLRSVLSMKGIAMPRRCPLCNEKSGATEMLERILRRTGYEDPNTLIEERCPHGIIRNDNYDCRACREASEVIS